MTPDSLILYTLSQLHSSCGFTPRVAAELECYVIIDDTSQAGMDAFWRPVLEQASIEGILIERIEKEHGDHQYEIVFGIYSEVSALGADINRMREIVAMHASRMGLEASFAARPFADKPASGLHIHCSLWDANAESVFIKTDEYISPALYHALGGVCAISPYVMPLLCPSTDGFLRYNDKDHVARTVSWGSNNRSCAVRIPYSPLPDDKRLEWRLPCADASPDAVLALMLHGIAIGFSQRMEPPAQYYGLAAQDATLAPLPITLEDALAKLQALPDIFLPLNAQILQEWMALRPLGE